MAERTNPHANLIIGAQDEATPVFEKIKASSQSMAAGVEQAATKAAGAVGGIGDKAAPAAQKLDGITTSMIRQVQRLNAELEAGGARNAAYIEKMASIKGADLSAMAPYLADLKKAEAAQRVATTGLDHMGMSAKQTAAALRQVPMQFTDIVVSLQGGQAPLTVFLQQGGQLKDMFGGAGNAARALGGYVAGLVNPFTLAAAAIASIAVAYKQGSAEADGYRMALVMTGNAAGTTASQMQQMAGRISSVVGTQGAAAEALAQMAASGRVASQSLEYFSEVAIKFERTTGTAISETVKRFAELGASPVDASRKLNEETNYLTASIYEQIKALKDQGREADAAALAQTTYADALNNRSAQITQNLGAIEGAWKAIKDAAKSGWDAMLNVGRADSLGTQIDNMRAKIAQVKGQDKNRPFSMPWDTSLADLEKQLSYLTEQERVIRRGAEAQAQRTQAEKDAIAATDALQKTQASGLTNQQKMNKALEEYARHIEKLKATNPASALLSPDAIARGEKAIRDQFSDKGKGSAGINATNKELADQAKLLAELNGLTGSFAKEWDTLSAVYAKGGMSLEQLTSAQAKLLAKQPAIKAEADEQAKAQQVLAKANLDAAASREKYIASLAAGLDKIQAEIVAQEEATARMGLSKEAIADLDAAKLNMMATDLELQAIKAMDRNLDQQTYDALKKQAAAYRELAEAKQAGAAKEVAVDAAKKAADEWQRTSEQINSTLTDALMRGFESGKDFAKNLRDTVVNMFKTMVLRPVVSAIVSPISGALLGGLGLAGSAAASQGQGINGVSTAISGASLLGRLGAFGGGMSAGFGGLMGSLGLSATGSTLGGAMSAGSIALGSGNILGGLGTFAGALGPIALGIGLLSSAFSRKLKDQGIQGTLGGEAGFEGQQYRFYKGGLFRSDKTKYSAIDPELARVLSGGFSAVQDQVTDFAEALSLPTDRIKGFTTDIKVSFKGLDEAGIQKALQDALATGSNELAQQVLGTLTTTTREVTETLAGGMGDWGDGTMQTVTRTIEETTYAASEYARDGEKAIDTLTRLATSLGTVNTIWDQLGNTLLDASLAGADAASKIADAFGGLEAMAQATGTYFQNFYPAEEQRAAVERQLNEALGKLNLQLPDIDATDARAQYRALAEAQDRNTEAGREAYVVLLKLSGAFASVTASVQSAEDAYSALERSAAAQKRVLQGQLQAARDVAGALESVFGVLHDNVRELYGEVESTRAQQAAQASQFISAAVATALASGYLPDSDQLSEAIAAARGGLDASHYGGDTAERDYAALVLAGQLAELEDVAGKQLTDAQRTVAELERQTEQLDETLVFWQQQIDIASGTYDATLSVSDAVNRLSALLGGGGKPGSSTPGSSTPGGGGSSGYTAGGGVSQRVGYGADEALTSFDKFKAWYDGLRHNVDPKMLMGSGYQVPDWMRVMHMAGDSTDKELFGAYLNMKNNPETAKDYERIMTTGRSGMVTDGSTLVRSDLSKMPTDAADFFAGDRNSLLSYESFGLDPVLGYRLYKDGPEQFGLDIRRENFTEWLRTHKWTPDGIVESNNTLDTARPYDGYKLPRWDTSTGNIVDLDGGIYSPDGRRIGTAGRDLMTTVYGAAFVSSLGSDFGDASSQVGADEYYVGLKQKFDAAIAGGQSAQDLADEIARSGASMADVAAAYGISVAVLEENLRNGGATNIPKFDVGTNYVPRDMLAYIHEGEAVVPKAYNPALNNGGPRDSARIEALIEKLTAEVAELKAAANATADNTGKSANVLVAVQRGNSLSQVAEPTF